MVIPRKCQVPAVNASDHVNWSRYARDYDLVAALNPAYQEILTRVTAAATRCPLQPGDVIVELGAGTGNVSTLLARLHPNCSIIHVEPDPAMNEIAANKARSLGTGNLTIQEAKASSLTFGDCTVRAVVCVHSLYAFPDPRQVIASAATWLKEGGVFIACDLGRIMDVADWRRYMFAQLISQMGLFKALGLLIKAREAVSQNRRIAASQRSGRYWCHSLEEFRAAFEKVGLVVEGTETCFRGYSDFVVSRKPDAIIGQPKVAIACQAVSTSEGVV